MFLGVMYAKARLESNRHHDAQVQRLVLNGLDG